MKILTVSDRVEQVFYQNRGSPRFQNLDLILACGDLPPEYLTFLREKLDAPLFYIRGNHDLRLRDDPPAGCVDLDGRVVKVRDLKIMGLEGSRWYNGGPFQYTEGQMRLKAWRLYPRLWLGGVDIIITHAPPRFMGDAEDPCHRGFRVFRKLIENFAPRFFIHGHIHAHFNNDSDRITDINRTRLINAYGHYLLEIPS
ncbi:MAG: metallophosphoesterase [Pseudomonadota bacterium]